jgi:hypothetical protein
MDHPAFVEGDLHTGFIEQHSDDLLHTSDPWLDEIALIAASVHGYRMRVKSALTQGHQERPASDSRWMRLGRARALRGAMR